MRLVLSKWDGDLTLIIEDKHMDQTPWFNDFCPFLHTMKNGSCWKRPWHYQSAEETAMPALSGEYFTLLSSHSSETSWDVPLQWNCIMFRHCFIQTVTKPNSLYNSKRSLSTHLSSVSQLIFCLKHGHLFCDVLAVDSLLHLTQLCSAVESIEFKPETLDQCLIILKAFAN